MATYASEPKCACYSISILKIPSSGLSKLGQDLTPKVTETTVGLFHPLTEQLGQLRLPQAEGRTPGMPCTLGGTANVSSCPAPLISPDSSPASLRADFAGNGKLTLGLYFKHSSERDIGDLLVVFRFYYYFLK